MNNTSTRYYSSMHEQSVANNLEGNIVPGSGSGRFVAGDVEVKDASMFIECKTSITDKSSFSIKKDWIEKAKNQSKEHRLDNYCLSFRFGPEDNNYYVINERLMKILVETLKNS